MASLYPFRFRPVFRQYLWGGRRLESSLGKCLGPGNHWAESWEVCDHGPDQSVVEFGPLAGTTLHQLVDQRGRELLGRHYPQPRFPLLLKYLDAQQPLSVQVHPDNAQAARLVPPDMGKSEAWFVLEASPGSVIYAGLKRGVDRNQLAAAIRQGRCDECLHSFAPRPGDCIYLPFGTVHALGAGLLVAEIQQASDVTFRLFDWNRLGPDGKPRPLHVEQGLDCVDFQRGPVEPQQPATTQRPEVTRLVQCQWFIWDRVDFASPLSAGGDGRCHIIAVAEGTVRVAGDPSGTPLVRGATALLSANLSGVRLMPEGRAVLLDAYLP